MGIFIGTFAPPHAGHDEVMRQALAAGLDYVVIISNDLALHKRDTAGDAFRHHLVETAYRNDPRILVPRMDVSPLPVVLKALRYLQKYEKANHISLRKFGLMGSDVAEKISRRLLWHLIPVASYPSALFKGASFWEGFFVSTRSIATTLPDRLEGRPVTVLVPNNSYSSTQIRDWFTEHLDEVRDSDRTTYERHRQTKATLMAPEVFDAYVQYLVAEQNKASPGVGKTCSALTRGSRS